ncbi:MAG TPA: PDZ domain-containing protein [Acidimicrobiales bacterium]|nr:PDZ domain-containing protein [Acidimicrobiales bacterium]
MTGAPVPPRPADVDVLGPQRRVPPRRRRWVPALGVVLGMLAVAAFVASRIDLPYYALSPGSAEDVGPLVHLPPGKGSPLHGRILLTDVLLTQVTALSYLADRLSADTDLEPASRVLGSGSPAELAAQGYLQMAASKAAAVAAALRRLGYQVPERDAGVVIDAIEPGTPASRTLRVGQVVSAVGAVPTPDACAFVAALHALAPGDTVELTVERTRIGADGAVTQGPTVHERVRLARAPRSAAPSGCPGVAGPNRALLGVAAETRQVFSYPFRVSVSTPDVGGPSAGLAMSLTVLDKLSGGRLTGGATVAATGTISPEGAVGDVAGVAQKTVAVERAGATVFLVPPPEYKVAIAHASPSLHVYAVATLDQALGVLARLGGHVPPPPAVPAPGA